MQTKFKYTNSLNTYKNNNIHPQKNPILPYINLLDKCTRNYFYIQKSWGRIVSGFVINSKHLILRFYLFSDKLKNPLVAFYLYADMQHLQIRLRKFISSVKSKAKMEQLMKFKENMNLGQWHDRSHDRVQ